MASLPPSVLNVDPNANDQPVILRTAIPFLVLSILAFGLRLASRRLKKTTIALDDYMCAVALLFNICGFVLLMTLVHYKLGRHLLVVDPHNYILINKLSFASEIIYASTISCIKLSILFFYQRIFETRRFQTLTYILIAIVTSWWIAVVLVSIFSCHPINGYWDHTVKSTCISTRVFYLANSITNILSDVMILVLPVSMVWRLQTSRGQKVALTSIFGLGGFIVIVSSVRVAFIIQVGSDFTWDSVNPEIWSSIETSVGVICACLPSLRPVGKYAFSTLSSIISRRARASEGQGSESALQLGVIARGNPYVPGTKKRVGISGKRDFENLDEEWDGRPIVQAI